VSQLGSAPVSDTLNVVYLGLFPTMLGFTTWAYALARTPSGKMGATTYAVPGLVVLMSWLILGQVPRWLTIAGGALCLAGVAVSRGRKRSPAPLKVPGSVGSAAGLGLAGADGGLDAVAEVLVHVAPVLEGAVQDGFGHALEQVAGDVAD
jgi:EamA-like transporter family